MLARIIAIAACLFVCHEPVLCQNVMISSQGLTLVRLWGGLADPGPSLIQTTNTLYAGWSQWKSIGVCLKLLLEIHWKLVKMDLWTTCLISTDHCWCNPHTTTSDRATSWVWQTTAHNIYWHQVSIRLCRPWRLRPMESIDRKWMLLPFSFNSSKIFTVSQLLVWSSGKLSNPHVVRSPAGM